jgi:hypothetical protein
MQGRLLLWVAASLLGCSAEADDSDVVGSEPGTGGSPQVNSPSSRTGSTTTSSGTCWGHHPRRLHGLAPFGRREQRQCQTVSNSSIAASFCGA